MADVSLETAADRVGAAEDAGDTYQTTMEDIRDTIDSGSDSAGTSLGVMVSSQLQITEADTLYQVQQGIPNNMSKAVKTAAAAVKQAAS